MTELLQTEARPQGAGAPGTDLGRRRGPWPSLARVLPLLGSFAVIAIFVLLVVAAHAAGAAGGCGGG
jgi:hypothetical protein